MRISAIVCAYNEQRLLAGALHSLLAQTRAPDEVIVVNNASTDGFPTSPTATSTSRGISIRGRRWCG
jgi:GT2 family glycosyltransferase